MKSVLISIRPKWCKKIANGEKTIEVRKTAPQEVPFKAYIYESRNGGHRCKHCNEKDSCYSYAPKNVGCYNGRGKVIGEFICDRITDISVVVRNCNENYNEVYHNDECKGSCLTWKELQEYGKDKPLYGWHISDLKIYDKPKELSEFCIPCKVSCENCKNPLYFECWCEEKGKKIVTRPPQSWQYIGDLGEEE